MADRISFKSLSTELVAQASIERGLLRTIVDLVLRPGAMLLGYLSGERRTNYVGVIPFFILVVSLSVAVQYYSGAQDTYIESRLSAHEWETNETAPFTQEEYLVIEKAFLERLHWFLYISLPLFALVTWRLFGFWNLSYVEHCVVNAFVLAASEMIGLPFLMPYFWLDYETAQVIETFGAIVSGLYFVWVYADVSRSVRGSRLMTELPRSISVFALQIVVLLAIVLAIIFAFYAVVMQ